MIRQNFSARRGISPFRSSFTAWSAAAALFFSFLVGQTPILDLSTAARAGFDLAKEKPSDKKNFKSGQLSWAMDGGAPALRIEAALEGSGYHVWRLDRFFSPEAPFFIVPGAELRLRVKAISGVDRIVLRFVEKTGECVQLKPVRDLGDGWKLVSWKLEDASIGGPTWGPNRNERLDLAGAEVHLAIDGKEAIALLVSAVEVVPPPGFRNPLSAPEPPVVLNDFESPEQGRVAMPIEAPNEKSRVRSGRLSYAKGEAASGQWALRLDGEMEGSGYMIWYLNDFLPAGAREKLSAGSEIRLKTLAVEGPSRIALRVVDHDGEILQLKAAVPGATWGEARFSLVPESINGATWGQNTNRQFDFPLREIRLAVDSKNTFSLLLDRLEALSPEAVRAEKSAAEFRDMRRVLWAKRLALSFSGIPAFAVFRPEDAPQWKASYRADLLDGAAWEWAPRGPDGVLGPWRALPQAAGAWSLPLPIGTFGPLAVEVRARKGDEALWSTNLPYSVVHPITWRWKSGDALLGICTHISGRLENWSDLRGNAGAEIARLYKYLGVSHDRGEHVDWNGLEKKEGEFNWEKKDKVFAYLKDLGVRVFQIYAYTTQWATTGDPKSKNWLDWARAAPRTEAFATYCQRVAERYKDQIDGHEIWNEPNWGFWKSPTAEFPPVAIAAKRAIAAVDPGKLVVVGGYAQGEFGKIEEIVKATASEFPHAAFHIHGSFEETEPAYERYLTVFSKYGYRQTQLINSETGWTTVSGGAAITNQAAILIKKYAYQLSRGIFGVMLYDLLSDGPDPKEGEHHYGIVSWDRTVKPAFSAYNYFIHQLGGAKPVLATDLKAPVPLTQFKQGADRVALLWNQKDAMERPVRLSGFPGEAQVCDLYGNPVKKIRSGDGFAVTGIPVWVRIPSFDGELKLEGGRLMAESTLGAPPGEWAELLASWKEDLGGKSLALAGAGLEFDPPTAALAPGERSRTLRVRLKKGDAPVDGRLALLDGGKELESLSFRMNPAPRIARYSGIEPRGELVDQKGLAPVLARDTRQAVKELLLMVGGNDNEPWEGPQDLSGKLFVANDAQQLCLLVEVSDSKLVEPVGKPEEMWKADSVQIALDGTAGRLFEIGIALQNGKPISFVWKAPPALKDRLGEIQTTANRVGEKTYYALTLPLSLLGRQPGQLFGASVLVNDADKRLRKQFLEFGSGIGFSKDPDQYLKFTLSK
ncbi:MAG: hypothetical protein J0L75_12660 [Spirochaetes bacterium]|nr:hypothetical protein [Spirochaetota bacterium]